MSEATTENTTGETVVTVEQQGDPAALGEGGKKALDAERNARKAAEKSAADLQAQLDSIKKSQMSDLEKAQTTAQEYQKAAEKAVGDALRWRIAAKHGISDDDAETFLTGGDEESLTRQAERLSAMAKTTATPKPDLSQGAKGSVLALNGDPLEQALRDKLGI